MEKVVNNLVLSWAKLSKNWFLDVDKLQLLQFMDNMGKNSTQVGQTELRKD